MSCWVKDGIAFVHCYSDSCSGQPAYPLGLLEAPDTAQVSRAFNLAQQMCKKLANLPGFLPCYPKQNVHAKCLDCE